MKTTAKKEIDKVVKFKPSQYERIDLLAWLNEVEERIIQEVVNASEEGKDVKHTQITSDTDDTTELSVETPYTNLYYLYITSQIDFNNQDYELYNNVAGSFNNMLQEYSAYYKRTHQSKKINQPRFEY